MKTLEQRMLEAIRNIGPLGTPGEYSESCYKITIEEIRKAFEAGHDRGIYITSEYHDYLGNDPAPKDLNDYLSENNLISKE